MLVGILKEIKDNEYRVALLPESLREVVARGHEVIAETSQSQGISDRSLVTRNHRLVNCLFNLLDDIDCSS